MGETSLVEAPTSEGFTAAVTSTSLTVEETASLMGTFGLVSCFHREPGKLITETTSETIGDSEVAHDPATKG